MQVRLVQDDIGLGLKIRNIINGKLLDCWNNSQSNNIVDYTFEIYLRSCISKYKYDIIWTNAIKIAVISMNIYD